MDNSYQCVCVWTNISIFLVQKLKMLIELNELTNMIAISAKCNNYNDRWKDVCIILILDCPIAKKANTREEFSLVIVNINLVYQSLFSHIIVRAIRDSLSINPQFFNKNPNFHTPNFLGGGTWISKSNSENIFH